MNRIDVNEVRAVLGVLTRGMTKEQMNEAVSRAHTQLALGFEETSEVTLSGFYKNYDGGPSIQAFERALEKYVGVRYAKTCSNGTSALHLALMAAGIGRGHRVAIPPLTFSATATAVMMVGAEPVFVDVEQDSYTISPNELWKLCEKQKIDAVIPVHLLGVPCKMNEIMHLANDYNLIVIEDNAQALGASFKGTKTGAWGHLATCFSGKTKIRTTKGKKRLYDIEAGDQVYTQTGIGTVKRVLRRKYDGPWVQLRYGKWDSSLKINATAEHPILVYRDGVESWKPIKEVQLGDWVYLHAGQCEMCGSPTPIYRKLCGKCYMAQDEKARKHLRKVKTTTKNSPSWRLETTSKHHLEDVVPIMEVWVEKGYRCIPLAGVIPDFIAIKDQEVIAVEVERGVSSPRLRKRLAWQHYAHYYDDVVFDCDEPKWHGHPFQETENSRFVRVPVIKVTQYYKNPRRTDKWVYNLEVTKDPTYIAHDLLVHNCSFQETKVMSTLGEGGAVLTNNLEYSDRIRALRNHGQQYPNPEKGVPVNYNCYNFRMTEAQAAMGIVQLEKLNAWNKAQVDNREILKETLEPLGFTFQKGPPNSVSTHYIIGTTTEYPDRLGIVRQLHEWGWGEPKPGSTVSMGYSQPIYRLPLLKKYYKYCPVAEWLCSHFLWFDVHRWQTPRKFKKTAKQIHTAIFEVLSGEFTT